MINKMQTALIKKDLRSVTSNKNMLAVMLIVPFIFTVVLPTIFILLIHFIPQQADELQKMLALMPIGEQTGNFNKDIIFLLLNRIMPVFFMIIPIMAASVMAASSFVGEKEKRTLETLLYCPLSLKEIVHAKIFASFALSMIVSFVSFFIMVLVTQAELLWTTGTFILPDLIWAITMLLLSPALTLIAITLIVKGSAKAQTMEESQQRSVFLVLPIILLIVGQFTGLFLVDLWLLLGMGAFLAVIALFYVRTAVNKISYETLFK